MRVGTRSFAGSGGGDVPAGPASGPAPGRTPVGRLLLLTAAAVLVHGYHLGADDSAIYIPAIKKLANPALYPFGAPFFMSHAHLSYFPDLVGGSARWTSLPVDLVIFLWCVAGAFLLLLAAWNLMCRCFVSQPARWAGVALLAGAFTVPVAGTALVIMDPYLTARTLSTPVTLLSVAAYLAGKPRQAIAWLLLAGAIHPQMSVYGGVFLACLAIVRRHPDWTLGPRMALPAALPFPFDFRAAQGPARQALLSRSYFFVSKWAWYEWVGVFAPLGLLAWLASSPPRGTKAPFQILVRALVPFGLMFTAAGAVLASSVRLENYTRLQPMRAFQLIYVVLFPLVGGVLGERVLKRRTWRWLGVFAPLAAGMLIFQCSAFSASPHIEFPGVSSGNSWTSAFLWIRGNTPRDAVFGMDPNYMASPGEDMHGFRAIAERSALADLVKDSGAVSLFPALAEEWRRETLAQRGWNYFAPADFQRLAGKFPVTWILVRRPSPAGMICPYENRDLAVCRIGAVR
jgi:hypothetical protein